MEKEKLNEYRREYNKDTYKVAKIYIRKENYEEIAKHWKNEGHKSLSNYVNSLIREDMAKGGVQTNNTETIQTN